LFDAIVVSDKFVSEFVDEGEVEEADGVEDDDGESLVEVLDVEGFDVAVDDEGVEVAVDDDCVHLDALLLLYQKQL
jgi:hypothetical protein